MVEHPRVSVLMAKRKLPRSRTVRFNRYSGLPVQTARLAKRSNALDCKSSTFWFRRFESFSAHQNGDIAQLVEQLRKRCVSGVQVPLSPTHGWVSVVIKNDLLVTLFNSTPIHPKNISRLIHVVKLETVAT